MLVICAPSGWALGRLGPSTHADDVSQEIDAVSHLKQAAGDFVHFCNAALKCNTARGPATKIKFAPQKKKSKVLVELF